MPEEKTLNIENNQEKSLVSQESNVEVVSEQSKDAFFEEERAKERVAESDQSYKSVLAQIQSSDNDDQQEVEIDARAISAKMGAEAQVQNLVQLAFDKGVVHAVKVAKQLDYYSLDKFHDLLLSEELHRALVSKGLLKED